VDYFSTGLGTLAILLLLSGIDDFIPLVICLKALRREPERFGDVETSGAVEQHIAIFVPCWRESKVIGNMVRHNLAAIRYRNFAFFLGVYPNDKETIREASQLASEFPNVHVAECPRPGPTSKADCLNSIYLRMAALEQERGSPFDTVVLHDAEDLIHPYALNVINRAREHYEMVQVPVLPLEDRAFRDHSRRLLRRVCRVPDDRHAGEATERRLRSVERRGHRVRARSIGATRPGTEQFGFRSR